MTSRRRAGGSGQPPGTATPRIVYAPLTRRWFVATRYVEKVSALGERYIVARQKFDVTDQMHAILSQAGREAVTRGKPTRVTVKKAGRD